MSRFVEVLRGKKDSYEAGYTVARATEIAALDTEYRE
jgi:hypothetical protein